MPSTSIVGAVSPDLSPYAKKTDLPSPATAAPPGISDNSVQGNAPRYALENHTHAGKARRARVQCAADGSLTWVFDVPFDPGVIPRIQAIAETGVGVTDVINVQVEGVPTNTQCTLRVTRTQRSVVSLIGLTVLSIPSQPGVTWVHMSAFAT